MFRQLVDFMKCSKWFHQTPLIYWLIVMSNIIGIKLEIKSKRIWETKKRYSYFIQERDWKIYLTLMNKWKCLLKIWKKNFIINLIPTVMNSASKTFIWKNRYSITLVKYSIINYFVTWYLTWSEKWSDPN